MSADQMWTVATDRT